MFQSHAQSHRGWKHNRVLRGHSQREHLREQPFRLLPLQLQLQLLSPRPDQALQVLGILLQPLQHGVGNACLLALVDAFELKTE